MRRALTVTVLLTIGAISAAGLLAALALDNARANHNVSAGLDMDPYATPANTATSIGSLEDCLDVTAGPFNDDGDGQTDEDDIGDQNGDTDPDDDGDTLIDEDPPGQMFDFDVWVTGIGHDSTSGLLWFEMPIQFDNSVLSIHSADVNYFLTQGGGSNVIWAGETGSLPGSDGIYETGGADIGTANDKGSGVLVRVTFVASNPGVSDIDIPLIDFNGDTQITSIDRGPRMRALDLSYIGDGNGDTFMDASVSGTTVAVDDSLACDPDIDDDGVLNEDDNCPSVANPSQTDTDGDGDGDACDLDDDADGFPDAVENAAGSNPQNAASLVEACDGVDNDGDTAVDEDGMDYDNDGAVNDPGPDADSDGTYDCMDDDTDTDGDTIPNLTDDDDDDDGRIDTVEHYIGTESLDACPDNSTDAAWWADFDNNGTVDIIDVLKFAPVILANYGDKEYNRRYDIDASAGINIIDVLSLAPVILDNCTNP